MLAELAEPEVGEVIRRWGLKAVTANTITKATALRAELRAVRARGYAIDDEEKEVGLRCVSAAVRGQAGKLFAAMSVSGPAFRMTKERVPEIGQAVMRAANELSLELGYDGVKLEIVHRAAG
jgi:DNA-binding IclR family transcriptional regulator